MHLADKEILDRLFTLVDELGDNEINFKVWGQCLFLLATCLAASSPWACACVQEFITGIAPIVRGTLVEKLNCTTRCTPTQ